MHFIALRKQHNENFEYDGMIRIGLLRRVNNNIDLFAVIKFVIL